MFNSITDIKDLKVGHAENIEAKTGCTVILCGKEGMNCSVDIRGGSPGTRDVALLAPVMKINKVHAILLTGGSAFGLDAAGGVMQYLEERNIGYKAGGIIVPIVPSAVIFDLAIGNPYIRPDKQMGYKAALNAKNGKIETGNIGVGQGATVGKMKGMEYCTKSGVGTASIKNGDLIVAALVVTNALGNIYNPEINKIIAGVKDKDGDLCQQAFQDRNKIIENNTTLAVVASNAKLTKTANKRVAIMAQTGLARTIKPVHTQYDGDIIFSLSSGKINTDINIIGALAAEVVSQAIINSVC